MKQYYLIDLGHDQLPRHPYLSQTMVDFLIKTKAQGKKSMLYLNKRGFYSMCICEDCQTLVQCPRCDIALTYHKAPPSLQCHHCGWSRNILLACEHCSSVKLKYIGVGTEQIENSIMKLIPAVHIFRMDSDTVSSVNEKRNALSSMHDADIIIGTKMITTGFDFQDIATIGIILLEQELQVPVYDTEERIYSNIKQLIGRAGRKGAESQVLIQTFLPQNPIVQNILSMNYKDFLKKTLEERKMFSYPPFSEIATMRYKNEVKGNCLLITKKIYESLLTYENAKDFEIICTNMTFKRDNQYFSSIIIKGKNIRSFLEPLRSFILKNKDLWVTFG